MNPHPDADQARSLLAGVAEVDGVDDDGITERWARVVWNSLVEPGDGVAGRLIAAYGARTALEAVAGRTPVAPPDGVGERELAEGWKRWAPRLARTTAVRDSLDLARARQVRLVLPGDDAWPEQIDDLGPHAPLALWVRGPLSALRSLHTSAAIVGARAATSYGEHIATELAADLAGGGIPIVSGGAYGIDAAAHRAALAVGGATVALMAGGVERAYPVGNSQLLDRIAAHGAVVSEVPCGAAPTKWRFLQRNRLIAALASATVVVEAGWRSGSLNTANHAAALGRPIGAVPGPVTSAASAGCHRLLREADAFCITCADDVRELLDDVPSPPRHARGKADASTPRTDDRTRVLDALSPRVWRTPDEIGLRSGLAVHEVTALLGLLMLESRAERGEEGWRRMTRDR